MEYILLGCFLVCTMPAALWGSLSSIEQTAILEHIAEKFYVEYGCSKADLLIQISDGYVKVYARRTDFKI